MAEKIIQLALNSAELNGPKLRDDNKARYGSWQETGKTREYWVGLMYFSQSQESGIDWSTVTNITLTLTANDGGNGGSQQVNYYTSYFAGDIPMDDSVDEGFEYIGDQLGSYGGTYQSKTRTIEFKESQISQLKAAFREGRRMIVVANTSSTTNDIYGVFTDAFLTVTYNSSNTGDSSEPAIEWYNEILFTPLENNKLEVAWREADCVLNNVEVAPTYYNVKITDGTDIIIAFDAYNKTSVTFDATLNKTYYCTIIAFATYNGKDFTETTTGSYTYTGVGDDGGDGEYNDYFTFSSGLFLIQSGSKLLLKWNQAEITGGVDYTIMAMDPSTETEYKEISNAGEWLYDIIEPYKYNVPCLYKVKAHGETLGGIVKDLYTNAYSYTVNYDFEEKDTWYWDGFAPTIIRGQDDDSYLNISFERPKNPQHGDIFASDEELSLYIYTNNLTENIYDEPYYYCGASFGGTIQNIKANTLYEFYGALTYENQTITSEKTPFFYYISSNMFAPLPFSWAGNKPIIRVNNLEEKTINLYWMPCQKKDSTIYTNNQYLNFQLYYDCPNKNITRELIGSYNLSYEAINVTCPQVNEECFYYVVLTTSFQDEIYSIESNKTSFTLLSSDEPEIPDEPDTPEEPVPPENTKRKHIINCRLISRHDTEFNWLTKNPSFIPYQGEIIVFDTDTSYSYERFKIGDGVTTVSKLPFANSLSQSEIDSAIQDSLKDGNYSINADTLGGISSSEYALIDKVVTSVNGQVGDILLIDGNLVSIPEAEETLEEGQYIVNAEQLGGIDSSRYALTENIVTINGQIGDVTIEKEDLSGFYSNENQPPYPVISVNGQTGEVVIEQPDLVRIEDVTVDLEEGIYLANADQLGGKNAAEYALIDNVVTSINGQTGNVTLEEPDLSGFYSETNPPKYPVTSVNGMSGDVTITIEQPDLVRIEDAEVDFEEGIYLTNAEQLGGRNAAAYALKEEVVTSINGQSGNVVLEERDLSNYYSTEHQPPYPVTSVNGSTGDIIIPDNVIIPDSELNLEQGIYLANADTLGGKLASEYLLKEDISVTVNNQTINLAEQAIFVDRTGAITGPTATINADSLGGIAAENYLLKDEIPETGVIFVDRTGATPGPAVTVNADSLGGIAAENYLLKSDIPETGVIFIDRDGAVEGPPALTDSDMLGGILAEEYARKEDVQAAIQEALSNILIAEGVGF